MDWENINEYALLGVFSYLAYGDIFNASLTCRRWLDVSRNDCLWRQKIRERLPDCATLCLSPGTSTWMDEYRRLVAQVPRYRDTGADCSLVKHYCGVSHLTFSSDGQLMASCGEDARLTVWKVGKTSDENDVLFEKDLFKKFGWVAASKVQFNKKGTLLMVTGVLKQNIHKANMGEILVYDCRGDDAGDVTSRIALKPHETVGCWFNNSYLISSDLEWLAHLISTNKFWINKVDYSLDSDPSLACMRQLYRLYNCSGSAVRDISVVPVSKSSSYDFNSGLRSSNPDEVLAAYLTLVEQHCLHLVIVPPHSDTPTLPADIDNRKIMYTWEKEYVIDWDDDPCVDEEDYDQELTPIEFCSHYHEDREDDFVNGNAEEDDWLWEDENLCENDEEYQWEYFRSDLAERDDDKEEIVVDASVGAEVINEDDKLLVFTTGVRTHVPHQIGVKLMSKIKFKKKLNIPNDIKAFIKQQEDERQRARDELVGRVDVEVTPWHNYREVAQMFDVVDVIFDFSGVITGYAVSPDSRYLYVNYRPWALNVHIPDPYDPPPVALCVERVVIDLARMEVVGRSHPRHRVFIPFDLCDPTPIQVTRHYASTIMRDKGIIIDRHSGVTVATLDHSNVTCCVTNPHNVTMAATASANGDIQFWTQKQT